VADETEISFKELQTIYQLLLAENRFLKAEPTTNISNAFFDESVIKNHLFLK